MPSEIVFMYFSSPFSLNSFAVHKIQTEQIDKGKNKNLLSTIKQQTLTEPSASCKAQIFFHVSLWNYKQPS